MSRRTLRALLPIMACLVILAGMTGAAAQTTSPAPVTTGTPEQKAAAVVSPAIVYIEQYWRAWVRVPRASELNYFEGYVNDGFAFEWGTRCTGFVVNPGGYVFTAGHCVDKGEEGARGTALEFAVQWLIDQGYIFQQDFGYWLDEAHLMWGVEGSEKGSDPDLEIFVQRGIAAGGLKTGEAFPARLVDYSAWSEGDGALLKVEAGDLPTVLVAPSASVTIGTEVLSVGYPGSTDAVTDASYEPTFKDGQVNAEKTREGGLLPVYEISAAMSGGMSGGPTVNLNGEVIGVNSFGIVGETEAFNFITPASIVTEMLSQNGVTNQLGPVDVAYRAGLDAFFQGDYRGAIAKFDEVLAISPTHEAAQSWKVEASKLAANQPTTTGPTGGTGGVQPPVQPEQPVQSEEGGFPVLAVVGIVAAVLVVGGGVFMMSRRKPTAPPPAQPLQVVGAPPPAQGAEAARVGFQPTPGSVPPQASGPPPAAVAPPVAPGGQAEAPAHFCPNCGHVLEPGAHFCPSCGHKIEA